MVLHGSAWVWTGALPVSWSRLAPCRPAAELQNVVSLRIFKGFEPPFPQPVYRAGGPRGREGRVYDAVEGRRSTPEKAEAQLEDLTCGTSIRERRQGKRMLPDRRGTA